MINQSIHPAGKQTAVFDTSMDLPGITNIEGVPMMNHLEIALVLGHDRPDVVKRSIERLRDQGIISFTPMVEPTPGGGKPRTVYYVNQRDSYVVVAQLCPEFTARIVDRWRELEEKTPSLPQTYREALLALVAQVEENEKLAFADQQKAAYIEKHQGRIEYMENVFEESDSIPVTAFGKMLSSHGFPTGQKLIQGQLRDLGFLYQLEEKGPFRPYEKYVTQGLFKSKISKPNAHGRTFHVTHILPKGQVKIWMVLAEHFGIKKELPDYLKPYRKEMKIRQLN